MQVSGTGKSQEQTVIAPVGCFYSFEVGRPGIAFARQVGGTPTEYGLLVEFLNNNVGYEAAMPAVAIWETIDAYDAVFEPHGNFIWWVRYCFRANS